MAKICPICRRRRAKRSCPGLPGSRWASQAAAICAPCCGNEREVTIDCPSDCTHLVSARGYEAAHKKPPKELAYPEVELTPDFLAAQEQFIGGLGVLVCRFAQEQPKLTDPKILAALTALAQAYHTLTSGLYYEKPPDSLQARQLYQTFQGFIAQYQKEQQQRTGVSQLRPSDILKALVFLLRLGQTHSNGRPLSRAYLDFLRAQLPRQAWAKEESRIIVPGR